MDRSGSTNQQHTSQIISRGSQDRKYFNAGGRPTNNPEDAGRFGNIKRQTAATSQSFVSGQNQRGASQHVTIDKENHQIHINRGGNFDQQNNPQTAR